VTPLAVTLAVTRACDRVQVEAAWSGTASELTIWTTSLRVRRFSRARRMSGIAPVRSGRLRQCRSGTWSRGLLGQSEYIVRVKAVAPLMEAVLRWLAEATPGSAELLRLMDVTPVPCGASAVTARCSGLYGYRMVPAGNRPRLRRHPRTAENQLSSGSPQYARRPTVGRADGLPDAEQGMSW